MEILRAIDRADALCPNPYTLEEKLCWCDEVTAELRRNIFKVYDVIETHLDGSGEVILPDDIPFERIELAYIGNTLLEKQDFRSFIANYPQSPQSGRLRIVYLVMPEPIRYTEIHGEFNTGENTIEIPEHPFLIGDKIEIAARLESGDADWSSAKVAYIIDSQLNMIVLDYDALEAETAASLAIRRVIDDITAIDEAPYDSMYIEYLLAKAALYQHDYTGYNAHMTQYNSLFDMLRKEYKTRNPLSKHGRFKNYSCI